MSKITLVTGGTRSGKSRCALNEALKYENRVFLATASVCDKEMKKRVDAHQAERGNSFTTIEEPIDLAKALGNLPANTDVVLLDCLTVWQGNLLYKYNDEFCDFREISELLDVLRAPPTNIILVTNEIGSGVVPENAMARAFRDMAGKTNQLVAEIADTVILVVSGIPVVIKG